MVKKGAIRVRKGGHQYFSSFKMLRDYVSSSRLYWHNKWYFKWHLYIVIERLICDLDGVRIRNLGYERGSQDNFQGIPETFKSTSQTLNYTNLTFQRQTKHDIHAHLSKTKCIMVWRCVIQPACKIWEWNLSGLMISYRVDTIWLFTICTYRN